MASVGWGWAPIISTDPGPSLMLRQPSLPTSRSTGPHLQQLNHEDQRLRLLLQLVQVLIAQCVVGEHVGQSTCVHVPLSGILAFCHLTQAPGQDGVDSCVLGRDGQMALGCLFNANRTSESPYSEPFYQESSFPPTPGYDHLMPPIHLY